jgi:hypothetical protein
MCKLFTESSSERELRIAKSILEVGRVTAGAASAFIISSVGKTPIGWIQMLQSPHLYIVLILLAFITVFTYWMNALDDNPDEF